MITEGLMIAITTGVVFHVKETGDFNSGKDTNYRVGMTTRNFSDT